MWGISIKIQKNLKNREEKKHFPFMHCICMYMCRSGYVVRINSKSIYQLGNFQWVFLYIHSERSPTWQQSWISAQFILAKIIVKIISFLWKDEDWTIAPLYFMLIFGAVVTNSTAKTHEHESKLFFFCFFINYNKGQLW